MSDTHVLSDDDLPALYAAADTVALASQRGFLRRARASLCLLVAAAAGGVITLEYHGRVVGGFVSLLAFGAALAVQLSLSRARPEKKWYDGRALAESIKSLAWLYAVGGGAYKVDDSDSEERQSASAFLAHIEAVVATLPALDQPSGDSPQISAAMRSMRRSTLAARKAAYAEGRIGDQVRWYSAKADFNRRRAQLWNALLLTALICGLALAGVRAAGLLEVDLLGLTSAVGAAAFAWLNTKDHVSLAEAYAVASHELSAIRDQLDYPTTDDDWAVFVSDAEQAISREHRLWQAARSGREVSGFV